MLDPIPALTLHQPWATLIAIGVKPWETRSWPTSYRGPLAIHAGSERRWLALCRGEPEIEQALADAGYLLAPTACDIGNGWSPLPTGAILAVPDLVSCVSTDVIVNEGLADAFGDYSAGRFAWHLHGPRVLPEPIPCSGRQRLWRPEAAIQEQLRALVSTAPVRASA